MSNLSFSFRITDDFLSPEETEKLKAELELYNNKSKFMRHIIKYYLNQGESKDPKSINYDSKTAVLSDVQFEELKKLVLNNNKILKELKQNGTKLNLGYPEKSDIYEGQEQKEKTDLVLNLIEQF